MSFILEVCVLGRLFQGRVQLFVVAAAGHVSEHLFMTVCEGQWELRLFRRSLYFSPLRVSDCIRSLIGARSRLV